MRCIYALVFLIVMTSCTQLEETVTNVEEPTHNRELIVLAAPQDADNYYSNVRQDIFDFHINYARQIAKHDQVLILSGEKDYDAYVAKLGKAKLAKIEMQDIWMRDFSPQNAANPIMFRYTAAGQGGGIKGQWDADYVQHALTELINSVGTNLTDSRLLNDGGNFVDDYAGNVVLSRKFLRDNDLTDSQARKLIKQVTGATNVAFIEADEQGGLEHADGVVAFISENTLVINSYPNDPEYAANLRADLKAGLPDVTIHEIVTPYDGSEIYDERFGSACGLYTNMLVTPARIYLPQFGLPEDAIALDSIRAWTDREIVRVQSGKICHMGGGVRCMSWQLRGAPAEALLAHLKSE